MSTIWIEPLAVAPPSIIALSRPSDVNLIVYRGDSGRFRVRVTDANAAPVDVSAATWDCDVRSAVDSPTVVAQLEIEPDPVDTAAITVIHTPIESAKLPATSTYDLEMTLAGEVTTLIRGTISATGDVSRTP